MYSVDKNFNQSNISVEGHKALGVYAEFLKNAIEPTDNINYQRAKQGITSTMWNMILKSIENVPTTLISYEELMNEIERIPEDL